MTSSINFSGNYHIVPTQKSTLCTLSAIGDLVKYANNNKGETDFTPENTFTDVCSPFNIDIPEAKEPRFESLLDGVKELGITYKKGDTIDFQA